MPPKTRAQPTNVQEVSFEKHVWGKERKYSSPPKPAENDVRAPSDRDQQHDFNILHIRLREIESKKGKKIGLSLIIPHDISTDSEIDEKKSTEEVPQQKGWSFVSPIREQPVSLEEISERAKRARCRLFESSQHREKIAKLTSKQQNCRMWYEVRQPRISASQCKRCVLKPTTSPSKAVAEVLFYCNKIQTKAMKDGIEWEPKIIKFMADTGHHVREFWYSNVIKRQIEAVRVEYRKKKGYIEREKQTKVAVARRYRTRTGKGICRPGPVRARTVGALRQQNADISLFIQHKFPVPHRQSPPSRLSNLNKTPLITSARKFTRLGMTTRHTIYNELCDLHAIST